MPEISNRVGMWVLSVLIIAITLPIAAAQESNQPIVPESARPDPRRDPTEPVSVHGAWSVAYLDKHLGVVHGIAKIDEYVGKVRVILDHPRTREKFVLVSKTFERTDDKISITLEGEQPILYRNDGTGYPRQPVIVPEKTTKVQVRVGANQAEAEVSPRIMSDLDTISLEMTVTDYNTIRGTWSYRADPFTGRDRNGGGRFGKFERLADGTARQSGPETWTSPKPVIWDTFVLSDQLSYTGGFSDLPNSPHRFMNNRHRRKTDYRALVIVGTNLPQSPRRPAVFKSESEHVTYTAVRYGAGIKRLAHGIDLLSRTKKKFRQLYPKLDFAVDQLDYIILQANLSEGVLPGDHSFTMNGVDGAWRLKFGDNRAEINFVRAVRPTSGGAKGEDTEATQNVFIPEPVQIEIRTSLPLAVDRINVMVGRNGKFLKLANGKKEISARRVADRPRIFRTSTIQLVDARTAGSRRRNSDNKGGAADTAENGSGSGSLGRVTARINEFGRMVGTAVQVSPYTLPVQIGDVLEASIAQPGLISLEPGPARAVARLTPAKVGALFKRALFEAVQCVNYNIRRKTKGGIAGGTRPDFLPGLDFLPKAVDEIQIDDWHTIGRKRIGEISRIRVFWWDKLKVDIRLGDYAAMILLRRTFMSLMKRKIKYFSDVKGREAILGIRHSLEPHVLELDHVMRWMNVKGPDGEPIFFSSTYRTSNRSNSYGRDARNVPDWILTATREALNQYVKIMKRSLKVVRDIKACGDIEDLLKMTGRSFDAVAHKLTPGLMKLEDAGAKGRQHLWTPDYWARTHVWGIENIAQRVKLHDDLADTDTQFVYSAAAIVAMPVAVWGGTAGVVAALIIEVADIGNEIYDSASKYYQSQTEIEFAQGTVEVLGYQRLRTAEAEEFTLARLVVALGFTVFQEAIGEIGGEILGKMVNFSVNGLRRIINNVRIRRGKRLLAKYNYDIRAVPDGLSDRNYLDIMAFVAHTKRLDAAGRILDDVQIKILNKIKELEARAASRLKKSAAPSAPGSKTKPGSGGDTVATSTPETKPKTEPEDLLPDEIKDLYYRKDVLYLMRDARETVVAALRTDPKKALRILRHSPRLTKEGFKRDFNGRLFDEPVMRGREAFEAPSASRATDEFMEERGWAYEIASSESFLRAITIRTKDPSGKDLVDDLLRDFEPETGTLTMVIANRDNVPGKMDIGIPNAPAPDGWPTMLFAQLRYMNQVGIGYAGVGGYRMRYVVMDNVTNARTNVQLAWFMQTHYPGRSLRELNEAGLLGDFLKDTRSVQYARSVINAAGYRIKDVRLKLWGEGIEIGSYGYNFKQTSDGETWEQFLKRHNLYEKARTESSIDIEIEVEPHPGATGKTTATGNPPSLPPGGPGRPSGGGDPNKTQIFPEFEPPSDLPASVMDARRQADRLYREAEETYGKVLSGEHKLPTDPNEHAKELARLRSMVRAKNLQDGIEGAIRDARRIGVPEDAIEGILDRHMGRIDINPSSARADTLLYLESAIREKQGYHVVDTDEAESLLGLLTRAQLGTSTDADMRLLSQKISDAEQQGGDFFDDLSRTGTNNAFTQKDWRKTLLNRDFELLTNKQGIDRLRKLAQEAPPSSGKNAADDLRLEPSNKSGGRRDARTGGDQNALERRLLALSEHEKSMVTQAAEGMKKLGVPEFNALDYASRNLRAVTARNPNPRNAVAQLVAEGIINHGAYSIAIDEFIDLTGLAMEADAKSARDAAAKRLGFAPLPSEIRPGWLYPAYH